MGHVATSTQADAGSGRSASSESEFFDDDSGTARAGHNNRRGIDRDSVRFQDEVADGDNAADDDGGGEGVKDKFQRQYRNVRCLKIIVILLLVVTAIVVTWAVYHFTRSDEQGNFKLECEYLFVVAVHPTGFCNFLAHLLLNFYVPWFLSRLLFPVFSFKNKTTISPTRSSIPSLTTWT